jgi:hypothetical protein
MPETSVILQELLTALTNAKQGTTLVLDQVTLGPTSAAALLDVFTYELQISSFTLDDVQLPAAVTGTQFTASGHDANVTADLTFTDSSGEVAIEALFHAPAITTLQAEFPALPSGFFTSIQVSGTTAAVTVPGLAGRLAFTSPRYCVAGSVRPDAGLMVTSVAARVDGQASSSSGDKGLLVEVRTDISSYHVAPLAGGWSFGDLGALLPPGMSLLTSIPLISTDNIGLRSFSLYLYRDAPQMSVVSLDVADITSPDKPLWSALGGKLQLTDVVVNLNLTYDDQGALALTGDGSVQGNFLLNTIALSVQIPSPPTGVWALTAYPNLSLNVLDDIGWLLGYDAQQFNDLLPAQLATLGGFELSYLRVAVNAGTFSLAEFTFAITTTQPWTLIPGVIELKALQIRLSVDGTPSVTGMVIGAVGLQDSGDILVSFGRTTPNDPWQLDAVSAAVALPSLSDLAQLAQGQDLASLVKAGGLDQLHFVMSDLNFGMTISPTALTRLGLTLQLANADDPLTPALDWDIIPGALTLTQFSFGFQINWGATVTKSAFGAFTLNGLQFDVVFASEATGGVSTNGLLAQYAALGSSGTIGVKDLVASVAPGVAAGVPAGLTITLEDAALAYLESGGVSKFLFAMDISAGSAVAGLSLGPNVTAAIASLKLLVVSAALTAQDVTFINGMSSPPVLPAAPGGIPAGFAFSASITNLDIGQLISDLASTYGISEVPAPIASLTLTKVSVSYQSGTGAFAFDLEAGFTVESAMVDVAVTIAVMPSAQAPATGAVTTGTKGYSALFTGQVTFAGLQFDLVFDMASTGTDVLVADFVNTGSPVGLQALVAGVSEQVAQAIPAGISLDLKEVKFVFLKQTSSVWAFGVRLGASIGLSELPVVGSKLPANETLAIQNLQILYSSTAMTAAQTAIINPLLPPGVTKLPATVTEGIEFDADVQLGGEVKHLQAGVTPSATPKTGAVVPASSTDPVKWLDVNKQFGIFSFQRVGVGYQDNVLLFALDASVSLGPLAFSMQALSVGSPLTEFAPVFSLQGLSLTFDRPPLSIGGAFLKVRETVSGQTFDSYYGELIVQAATFGLKALGGWAPDANPASFFIYLSVNVPLGGPPFLFVTGLAGGFGINSRLALPTIDQVSAYPLLPGNAPPEQGSPAETIKAVIPALRNTFSPMAGQYWVAAGIAFTSFEMIQAQAVVSVSFGVDLQIGVVGVCAMTFPTGDPYPVAYVEIDVVASFTPSTGLLAVDGKLSPASYLLGGFVKLTGGFAFYAWFAGEHQGDFVVSLGGYHPAFTKPDNYPVVPRLGLAFSLGPLKVVGQAYFALTPSMFMAGLRLTATFEAGAVKAWFDAGVDFLISWAPFHYEAHAWVTIGCSVDLGLFTLSVQIGADLQLWGPAFGGQALVDLDVVSFTIAFGAPRAEPAPIGWTTFAASFLPPPETTTAAPRALAAHAITAAAAGTADPGILKATITAGLLSQPDGLDWILDPDQFRILTTSTIPANHAMWAVNAGQNADLPSAVTGYLSAATPAPGIPAGMLLQLDYGTLTFSSSQVWAPDLNVAPMGETGVASYHAITLVKGGSYITGITVAPQLGASSTALWGTPGQASDPNADRLIPATLTGLAISPVPRTPDKVSDVPLLSLSYGQGNSTGYGYQVPAPDSQYTVTAEPANPGPVLTITITGAHTASIPNQQYLLTALTDPWVTSQRTATLDQLNQLGFTTIPGSTAHLDQMAQTPLTDWPAIARIGTETYA